MTTSAQSDSFAMLQAAALQAIIEAWGLSDMSQQGFDEYLKSLATYADDIASVATRLARCLEKYRTITEQA